MNAGTKAQNLIELQNLGYDVPEFRIVRFAEIINDYLEKTIAAKNAAKMFLHGKISIEEYSSRVNDLSKNLSLNKSIIKDLALELNAKGFGKVSFRTSAIGEDGPNLSFAGQYKTFLDKDLNEKNIHKYVKACFLSMIDSRIIQYLKSHKAKSFEIGGSAIIQKMFFGEKSGVLFTEDGAGCITINSVDSWKNTVVEGNLANAYKIKKNYLDKASVPKEFIKLAKLSVEIENKIGVPLDIEWAIRGNRIALLQMRPQTTHNYNYFFEWDSTNISESYPGITLPLTYSFIRNLYANVYPSFLSMIGTPRKVLEDNSEVFNNALGMLDGRVYYRISNWYEIVKLIPGKNNQQYFEAMLNPAKKRNPKKDKSKMDLKSMYVALRFGCALLSSPRLSKKFKKIFGERFTIYDNSKIGYMNANALLVDIQAVQKELLTLWAIPILNDVRVMIWHGMLRKVVTKSADHNTYLELLRGLSQRSSIKPLLALRDLGTKLDAEMAEKNIKSIEKLANDSDAASQTREYILEYGARTPDELKLENPRLVDSIEDIMQLALMAKDSPVDPIKKSRLDLSKFGFSKRMLLKMIIKNTRSAIDWREHFRLNRAQVFNLARGAYLQIGEIFVRDNIIIEKNDIFYMTDFEIENIINGHAWEYQAQDIIKHRKNLYKDYEKNKLSRRVTGDGLIAARHLKQIKPEQNDTKKLTGMGTSPGTITAKVIIAKEFDPNLDVRGKILVAPHIDPGWTLIFTQAIGVITERGNALSHVSIITRELGIPAVVALADATKIFKNGQSITIDGSTGEVTIDGKA